MLGLVCIILRHRLVCSFNFYLLYFVFLLLKQSDLFQWPQQSAPFGFINGLCCGLALGSIRCIRFISIYCVKTTEETQNVPPTVRVCLAVIFFY